ncbi:RDD family protein [Actinotalea sp. Marseille-Q4924]|uniref:RDD family protein n=1 Tax=Actinotalea sp. Marseille-Q4924 TaxID=2866571 RepID=UPI001CE3C1FB|nr:RDD family protein [Actinotalea sp. Marseille-Q4924]
MAARRGDIGSWLEGAPGGGASEGGRAEDTTARRDLGLPATGPGSMAALGRRVVGIVVDWGLASLISAAFFGRDEWATLAIFGVSTAVLVSTLGTTIGHRVAGIQVARLVDVTSALGERSVRRGPASATPSAGLPGTLPPPGPVLGLVRTVLLCLVIPAVVWDGSGRGLHDVAAGTVIVRR